MNIYRLHKTKTKSKFKDNVLFKFQENNLKNQNQQHLQILDRPSELSLFFTILQPLYSFTFRPFKELFFSADRRIKVLLDIGTCIGKT